MARLKFFIAGIVFWSLLSGCTVMKPNDFINKTPKFILEEYFVGKTKAWGLFEDRFGRVKRQFVVDIDGSWNGEILTLKEKFTYSDGEESFRKWLISKTDERTYRGTADDVVGTASGKAYGNALHWSYVLNLKTGDDSYWRVKFNDWMFLQPGGVLLNRARMSKFGIDVGEVTIAFMKGNDLVEGVTSTSQKFVSEEIAKSNQ